MHPLRVMFMAAEAAPFVKVGGLGDVAGSLPIALRGLPEAPDVRLVLPLHNTISREAYALDLAASFEIDHADGAIQARVFQTNLDGLPVYLISGAPFDAEAAVYTSDPAHDAYRYAFFSLAALAFAGSTNWRPDIIHAHDWHTAPAVYALRQGLPYVQRLQGARSLLTVHNLPYLGHGAEQVMSDFGLPSAAGSDLPDWAQHMPLPLGLWAADHINTVSEGYAEEILTATFGAGLNEFLNANQSKLSGIPNGLDQTFWNPAVDDALSANYDAESLGKRKGNKFALRKELDFLQAEDAPVFAIISRMDHQKGIDIALAALELLEDVPWQAVTLGTGDASIEQAALELAEHLPERVRAMIRFDASLARRIYAGADMILIPSRYEPCGLTQMIAMGYGCVPVARAVGGLKDTIEDFNAENKAGTGFLFAESSAEALAETMLRALIVYNEKAAWQAIQQRGMRLDFSWRASAAKYLNLYRELAGN